jgi:hypothetical protein
MINNLQATEEIMRNKAYELLCFVLAQYDFPILKNPIDEHWCPIIDIRNCEEHRLHEALVSFAALLRVNEDLSDAELQPANRNAVGSVVSKGKSKQLTRKQACNKIIHSNEIRWDLNYADKHPIYEDIYSPELYDIPEGGKYRDPIIHLKGEYQKELWTAHISLLKLICEFNQTIA